MKPFVYVVSYDHPSYVWNIDGVYLTRKEAVNAVTDAIAIEGFDIKKNFDRSIQTVLAGKSITTYAGVGNADGIYYYITRLQIG